MNSAELLSPPTEACGGLSETVYLLHGFAGTRLWMHRLARFLRGKDYCVRNWGYSSVRKPIAFHVAALREELERVAAEQPFRRLHFVTHSLGSIIVRQLFCEYRPSIAGRIVMLAPPNAGSHFAFAGSFVLGRLCPVLKEISTRVDSFVNRLGAPQQVEIGVIAASRDWVVRRRNTHLETEKDHVIVRGDHVRLPLLRSCAEQTWHFLATGAFRHAAEQRNEGPRSRFKVGSPSQTSKPITTDNQAIPLRLPDVA